MADPHHIPTLDAHDVRTVVLYRCGLSLAATSVILGACARLYLPFVDQTVYALALGVSAGISCCVVNLHLYNKTIRWVITSAASAGVWVLALAFVVNNEEWHHLLIHCALGLCFVSLSALALKEQFCFRIPGLRAVPAFLASSVLFGVMHWPVVHGASLLPAGLLLLVLCVAKWRMPLGHDIGNKAHYEV